MVKGFWAFSSVSLFQEIRIIYIYINWFFLLLEVATGKRSAVCDRVGDPIMDCGALLSLRV